MRRLATILLVAALAWQAIAAPAAASTPTIMTGVYRGETIVIPSGGTIVVPRGEVLRIVDSTILVEGPLEARIIVDGGLLEITGSRLTVEGSLLVEITETPPEGRANTAYRVVLEDSRVEGTLRLSGGPGRALLSNVTLDGLLATGAPTLVEDSRIDVIVGDYTLGTGRLQAAYTEAGYVRLVGIHSELYRVRIDTLIVDGAYEGETTFITEARVGRLLVRASDVLAASSTLSEVRAEASRLVVASSTLNSSRLEAGVYAIFNSDLYGPVEVLGGMLMLAGSLPYWEGGPLVRAGSLGDTPSLVSLAYSNIAFPGALVEASGRVELLVYDSVVEAESLVEAVEGNVCVTIISSTVTLDKGPLIRPAAGGGEAFIMGSNLTVNTGLAAPGVTVWTYYTGLLLNGSSSPAGGGKLYMGFSSLTGRPGEGFDLSGVEAGWFTVAAVVKGFNGDGFHVIYNEVDAVYTGEAGNYYALQGLDPARIAEEVGDGNPLPLPHNMYEVRAVMGSLPTIARIPVTPGTGQCTGFDDLLFAAGSANILAVSGGDPVDYRIHTLMSGAWGAVYIALPGAQTTIQVSTPLPGGGTSQATIKVGDSALVLAVQEATGPYVHVAAVPVGSSIPVTTALYAHTLIVAPGVEGLVFYAREAPGVPASIWTPNLVYSFALDKRDPVIAHISAR